MAEHTFDQAAFVAMFPEFVATNPASLQAWWTMATQYITPDDGWLLNGDPLQLALDLMTAHLAKTFTMISAGQVAVVMTSAGEGSVNLSMAPPPAKDGWQYWLSTTPYGLQLWALLSARGAGGVYVGASAERASFRKAGGVF